MANAAARPQRKKKLVGLESFQKKGAGPSLFTIWRRHEGKSGIVHATPAPFEQHVSLQKKSEGRNLDPTPERSLGRCLALSRTLGKVRCQPKGDGNCGNYPPCAPPTYVSSVSICAAPQPHGTRVGGGRGMWDASLLPGRGIARRPPFRSQQLTPYLRQQSTAEICLQADGAVRRQWRVLRAPGGEGRGSVYCCLGASDPRKGVGHHA